MGEGVILNQAPEENIRRNMLTKKMFKGYAAFKGSEMSKKFLFFFHVKDKLASVCDLCTLQRP